MKPGDKSITTCPLCGGGGDVYNALAKLYQQQRRHAVLGANLTAWLDSYSLTAAHFARWTSNPLHVERLTEECTRELYCLIRAALEGNAP